MAATFRAIEALSDGLRELEERGVHPLALVHLAQQGPAALPQIRSLCDQARRTETLREDLEEQVERVTARRALTQQGGKQSG